MTLNHQLTAAAVSAMTACRSPERDVQPATEW